MNTTETVKLAVYDNLPVEIYPGYQEMGRAAADVARTIMREAISARGEANIILATGNSQVSFLESLRDLAGIDWSRVNVFHVDNYLGLPPGSPADIPLRLHKHIVDAVRPKAFYDIPTDTADPELTCRSYEALLREHPADVIAVGWGESGHMGFNDPPYARFDELAWVKVVSLCEMSKEQVVGEGRFANVTSVPSEAITLTIPAILAARNILAIVPEARKASIVRACLEEPVSEERPGSVLRRVNHARLFLDEDSASKL
jgi:glucosamine-6-phosphate deaminase